VTRDMLSGLKPRTVLVDVAIDQGGCFATSRPTTHADPTYVVDDIVHYCVANMPGAVARTATMALTHATLPYVLRLAADPLAEVMSADPHFAAGVNVHEGLITHEAVATALGRDCVSIAQALSAPPQLRSA